MAGPAGVGTLEVTVARDGQRRRGIDVRAVHRAGERSTDRVRGRTVRRADPRRPGAGRVGNRRRPRGRRCARVRLGPRRRRRVRRCHRSPAADPGRVGGRSGLRRHVRPDQVDEITVRVTDSKGVATTASTTVRSVADFTLGLSPGIAALGPFQQASVRVDVRTFNGFDGIVTLSAPSLPTGIVATFSPPSVRPNGESVLTLQAFGSASPTTDPVPLIVRGHVGQRRARDHRVDRCRLRPRAAMHGRRHRRGHQHRHGSTRRCGRPRPHRQRRSVHRCRRAVPGHGHRWSLPTTDRVLYDVRRHAGNRRPELVLSPRAERSPWPVPPPPSTSHSRPQLFGTHHRHGALRRHERRRDAVRAA